MKVQADDATDGFADSLIVGVFRETGVTKEGEDSIKAATETRGVSLGVPPAILFVVAQPYGAKAHAVLLLCSRVRRAVCPRMRCRGRGCLRHRATAAGADMAQVHGFGCERINSLFVRTRWSRRS